MIESIIFCGNDIIGVILGVWAREELVQFQHAANCFISSMVRAVLHGCQFPIIWPSLHIIIFLVIGIMVEVWYGLKLFRFRHEMNCFTSSMGERPLRNINPILTQSPLIFPIKRFCNGNYVINIPLHIIPRITIPCSSVVELIGCYGYKDYPW